MKNLKKGDTVVAVRKGYQNYDHTVIPCEPKVYTVLGKSMDISLNETVTTPWKDEKGQIWCASAQGCDRRLFSNHFELLDTYISGNYNKDIILDKQRWPGGLKEFLEFKRTNDQEKAKKEADKVRKKLEEKL